MLFQSPVYSKASGSIAGLTYSHNKGGMYARARVTPTDPGSAYQTAMRNAFTAVSAAWSNTLTAIQRAAWGTYAANVAMTNRLGETIYLSGQQHYIRANSIRLQAGIPLSNSAPTTYNLGTFTTPTLGEVNENDEFNIAYTNTDDWASTDGGYMLAYQGLPQDSTIAYFKGPFRFMGVLPGATALPPTSPEEFTAAFPCVLGKLQWARLRIIQPDGRVSAPIDLGPGTIVAGA